jgi:hypothetical protein
MGTTSGLGSPASMGDSGGGERKGGDDKLDLDADHLGSGSMMTSMRST